MRQILGIDLGVSSVGWALIRESARGEKDIAKMGVRIVPEDPNFHKKFYEGNTASKNEDRRTKRGIRRNNQRFKLRRDRLVEVLKANQMYPDTQLREGLDKMELHQLRSESVERKVSLQELGRVLLHLNQHRGFKSNRKASSEDDNTTEYKAQLSANEAELDGLTIGQFKWKKLQEDFHYRHKGRVYLRSTYREELDRIWSKQQEFHPQILTGQRGDKNPKNLYHQIAEQTIFYQRPLKSQKHLISECKFQKHHRVVPKSSPLFQYFRILQQVNNLRVTPYGQYQAIEPSQEQKELLIKVLTNPTALNKKGILSKSAVLKLLGYKLGGMNFEELIGDQTANRIYHAVKEIDANIIGRWIKWDPLDKTNGGYMKLWHILYSLEHLDDVKNGLKNQMDIDDDLAVCLAEKVSFNSDYGSLSAKAIRKLIPYLQQGMTYDKACDQVGYDYSGYKTEVELRDQIALIKSNELRNPVVEQILNQMINIVNSISREYGKIDEVVVEMVRELKNSAKTRKSISSGISKNTKINQGIRERLKDEFSYSKVNGRDIKRFKLWEETGGVCLYCLRTINQSDLLNGNSDIEHIIPRSRSFDDSLANKIVAHVGCNREKGQLTAIDYVIQKGDQMLESYHNEVQRLYDNKKIGVRKYKALLTPGTEIEGGFLSRQMKDTQYIVVEAVSRLKTICSKVRTSTGSVTNILRDQWELKHVLQELVLPKYEKIGEVEVKSYKDAAGEIKEYRLPKNWSKRDDHRHHAVDALVTALTDQKIIFKLNNLNKLYQLKHGYLKKQEKEELVQIWREEFGIEIDDINLESFAKSKSIQFEAPIHDLRKKAKKHLAEILISIKKESKAVSPKINRYKIKEGTQVQRTLVPRGSLHNDTIHGKIKLPEKRKLSTRFDEVDQIVNPELKNMIGERMNNYGSSKLAFSSKNMKKDPIIYGGKKVDQLDVFVNKFTKRVPVGSLTRAQVHKIFDRRIRELVQSRIGREGNHKKAVDSFLSDPIFIDKNNHVPVRSVTVLDEGGLIPVREVDDRPIDYAYTAGNHHVVIYKDEKGNYHDRVVSLWEAVADSTLNYQRTGMVNSVIDRRDILENGWTFCFDLQKNDWVLIDLELDENEIMHPQNKALVSQHMYRVQKFSKKSSGAFDIMFRHQLEATIDRSDKPLRGITWDNFQSNKNFSRLKKVRINNLGEIIAVDMG